MSDDACPVTASGWYGRDSVDSDGRAITTAYPKGMKVLRGYDYAGRLTDEARSSAGSLIEDRGYTYTGPGTGGGVAREHIDRKANATTAYAYDAPPGPRPHIHDRSGSPASGASCEAGRVCCEYTLDGAGNRTKQRVCPVKCVWSW